MAWVFVVDGVGPSRWSTYAAVGAAVLVLGGLLLAWSSTASVEHPELLLVLGLALVAIGTGSVVGGVALRGWEIRHPPVEGSPRAEL
jgi:hypothetical protein